MNLHHWHQHHAMQLSFLWILSNKYIFLRSISVGFYLPLCFVLRLCLFK